MLKLKFGSKFNANSFVFIGQICKYRTKWFPNI